MDIILELKKIELNKLTKKLSQVENLANLIEDSNI